MKKCKIDGCSNFVWSHDVCKYHAYTRKMKGGDLYQAKPRKAIPKESDKRKREKKTYAQTCKELEAEERAKNNGKVFCFFCGEEIKDRTTWHHLRGRSGDNYTDREFLVPAHNECHAEIYHMYSYEKLIQLWWYKDFLVRLQRKDEISYNKEIKKSGKRQKNPHENLEFNFE